MGRPKKENKKFCIDKSPVEGIVDKKNPILLPIIRIKAWGFHDEFSEYFTSKNKDIERIRTEFNNRRYTVNDSGVSSRVLTHWSDKGILPESLIGNSAWKRFTLIEIVWLKAVCKMRSFGLPLEKIMKVRNWIMQWDNKNQNYPWFEYYVFLAQYVSDDPYIIITPDARAELGTSFDIEMIKSINENVSQHLLLISLKSLLKERGLPVKEIEILSRTSLTNEESELIRNIRSGVIKMIKTRIDNGKIKEMESTEVFPHGIDVSTLLKAVQKNKSYSNVLIRNSQGAQQSAEVTEKKRFR